MVAIRVANRVANRVSIAIRNPETFWNESGLRIESQPWDDVDDQVSTRVAIRVSIRVSIRVALETMNRNPETTMFRFF